MKSHQTVKWNSLQSDLKVVHYLPNPSGTVMGIMLNSAYVLGVQKSNSAT